jgi:hypothetical protein
MPTCVNIVQSCQLKQKKLTGFLPGRNKFMVLHFNINRVFSYLKDCTLVNFNFNILFSFTVLGSSFKLDPTPDMSKNSKRPRLQKTVASDIGPSQHFTHSSNTSTCTKQILTTAKMDLSEPTKTSPLIEKDTDMFDDMPDPETSVPDHPAGLEVLKKARRYVNSVWVIF